MSYKVIIAGGRDFNDGPFLARSCMSVFFDNEVDLSTVEIVSGGAKGADTLAEGFAKAFLFGLKVFPALWEAEGKAAGPIRNARMADYADALIVFWDGRSRGTKNMIDTAKKKGLEVHVFNY